MHIIKQTIRGCGTLPHVGDHPGTIFLWMFLVLGAIAGLDKGLVGGLMGMVIMGSFAVPLYLIGAYDRAQYSDRQR
jgi:hypothetical protein